MNELERSNGGTILERGKSKYSEKTLSQGHFCLGLGLLLILNVTHFSVLFSLHHVIYVDINAEQCFCHINKNTILHGC